MINQQLFILVVVVVIQLEVVMVMMMAKTHGRRGRDRGGVKRCSHGLLNLIIETLGLTLKQIKLW